MAGAPHTSASGGELLPRHPDGGDVAGSGQGEEFLEKSLQYEKGRSDREVTTMRKRVETWFDGRPGLKPKMGKTGHEH